MVKGSGPGGVGSTGESSLDLCIRVEMVPGGGDSAVLLAMSQHYVVPNSERQI